MDITFYAEKLFNLGPLPVTNVLLTSWIVSTVLIVFAIFATRKVSIIPTGLQNFAEVIVEAIWNQVEPLAGSRSKRFFPIVATLFLFIVAANYFGLLPIMSGFGLRELNEGGKTLLVPFFRSINSDLNTTLALALISAVATHYFAITALGLGDYLKRYFSLNPIFLFVGLLEIISEITKVISLSFRLFGNIFAGEALLSTISTLLAFIAPLPFMMLELLVGFVQAAVFMMLTLVFMVILTEKHEVH